MRVLPLALLALSLAVRAEESTTEEITTEPEMDDGVYILTKKNFKSFTTKNKYVLVKFYAPWCGHCKKMAPEYAKAAKVLKDQGADVMLAKVDDTVEKGVTNKVEIKGYPTVKFFVNGEPQEYDGARSEPGISEWLINEIKPAVTIISTKDIPKMSTEGEFVVIGKMKKGSKKAEKFAKLALSFKRKKDYTFYQILLKKGKPKMTLFRNEFVADVDGPVEALYTGKKYSVSALKRFIEDHSEYLISTKEDPRQMAMQENTGVVLFCVDDVEDADLSDFTATAKKYREEGFKFVVTTHTDSSNLGCTAGAQMVILTQATDDIPGKPLLKYIGNTDFTGEGAVKFIEDFKAGKIDRFIKSEDVPDVDRFESGMGAGVLTGAMFEKTVFDEKSDTLVEFYAPWCGHCKKYAPEYDELAKYIKQYYFDKGHNLRIMKANAIDNEFDAKVEGFPTIRFYPGGPMAKAKKSIKYEGAREREEVVDFVTENSYVLHEGKEECQWTGRGDSDVEEVSGKTEL